MKSKKLTSISDIREVLFEEIQRVREGGSEEIKRANSISKAAGEIFQSYKLQLFAMKMSGEMEKMRGLKGLIEPSKEIPVKKGANKKGKKGK